MNNTTIKIEPFSSQTGAGTLGYYARKYGTSIDTLTKLNPTITNPNMIQTGADLVVPTVSTPSVVTSSPAKKAYTEASKQIDQANAQYGGGQVAVTLPGGGQVMMEKNSPAYQNYVSSQTGNTQNNTPDIRQGDPVGNADPYAGFKKEEDKLNQALDAEKAAFDSNVTTLKAGLSAQAQTMIDDINRRYTNRIAEQKVLNEAYKGAVDVSGIRSGRNRYATEYQDQLFNKEVNDGLKRVDDLEAERRTLILQAEQARDEKQFNAVVNLQNQLAEKTKEKNLAVKNLYDQAMQLERLNIDKAKEQRASIKDRIDTSATLSKNIAGSLAGMIDAGQDQNTSIKMFASQYGVSEDFVATALSDYRREAASANPAIIKEYEYMRDNYGYKGSPLDYQRTKAAANRVATKTTSGSFTRDDASRYDLPEALIGMSDTQVIDDLNVGKPPAWFVASQTAAGHLPPDATMDVITAQWNQFRNSDDILVFRNTLDTNKSVKGNFGEAESESNILLKFIEEEPQ